MQEEQPGLLVHHVVMDDSHLDAVVAYGAGPERDVRGSL
jgi:hypothetical protein